jgi:hypothetical protein
MPAEEKKGKKEKEGGGEGGKKEEKSFINLCVCECGGVCMSSNIYVYSYIDIFYYPLLARCRKQTQETKKTLAQKKKAHTHTWTPYRCAIKHVTVSDVLQSE